MLPRERVFTALEHREPDRIPWGEHFIDYNVIEDVLGRPTLMHAKMRETQAYWDGRRDKVVADKKRDIPAITRALGMDIATAYTVQPADYRPKPMEKIDDETYRDEAGNLYRVSTTTHDLMPYRKNVDAYVEPTVEEVEKWIVDQEAQPPDDPNDSRRELIRHVVAEMKETHFINVCCGDVAFPTFGATEEEGYMNLLLKPDVAKKLAEFWGRKAIREVEVFAKLGVDGIMPCGDLGSSTGLLASPKLYREMVRDWNRAHAEAAHAAGLKVLKHCCGCVWEVIDDLADIYDAYEGIQASGGMDIRKLKERVGDRLCLWGGIWHEHINGGTVEDIRADAAYAFEYAAPGGGYIMGSSHSLAVGAKIENVMEMKRCRDAWGVYPIDPGKFI